MSKGRSNIAILKDAIRLQCAGLGGDESIYETEYPRPGEPVTRSMHVGEYLIMIHRKHSDDVFPLPAAIERFEVNIRTKDSY